MIRAAVRAKSTMLIQHAATALARRRETLVRSSLSGHAIDPPLAEMPFRQCSGSSVRRSAKTRGTHDQHALESGRAGPVRDRLGQYGLFPKPRQSTLLPTAHKRCQAPTQDDRRWEFLHAASVATPPRLVIRNAKERGDGRVTDKPDGVGVGPLSARAQRMIPHEPRERECEQDHARRCEIHRMQGAREGLQVIVA